MPANGKNATENLGRFHLKHIPCKEAGGILFVWYGDREPEGEPAMFEVLLDRRLKYSHLEDPWKTHYSRVIENQLDVSHLPFVHHNTIGKGNKTLCNGPKVVWLDENTLQTSANNEKDQGQKPLEAEQSVIKPTNLTFRYPNLWLNTINDKRKIFAFFIPVDVENSILAVRFYDRITGIGAVDALIAWIGKLANKVIERQDKRVVEKQLPKRSDLRMAENLVSADFPIIEYRRRREELRNR